MKTNLTKATAITITAIMLNACGGGGESESVSNTNVNENVSNTDTEKATLCIAKGYDVQNYNCRADCDTNEVEIGYYSDNPTCEDMGTHWVSEYNRNDTPYSQEQVEAYNYINNIRINMGVAPLKYDSRLEQATKNHEMYLGDTGDTYNVNTTHYEDNETYPSDYFTGVYPTDRAKHAGFSAYDGSMVYAGDVISYEGGTALNSMKVLMTAIYHRQAMIAFINYRLGAGSFDNDFAFKAEAQLFGFEYNKWDFLEASSPLIVVYPYDNQTNTQRLFREESPDPLPNYTNTGIPVSVDLNPAKTVNPEMLSFKLFYDQNNTEISNTKILDKDTDPNDKFTEYQFALFPLDVLDANTTYRAEFAYMDNGEEKSKVWKFTTGE